MNTSVDDAVLEVGELSIAVNRLFLSSRTITNTIGSELYQNIV